MRFFNFFQSGSRVVQSFIPGALLESSLLADQRSSESVWAVDEFMAIPAFNTEFPLIHGIGLRRESSQELSVEHFQ